MRRLLFASHGVRIYSYPAMLSIGAMFGILAGTYAGALHGLSPSGVYTAMLLLLPAALVGARLYYVAAHWDNYRGEPGRIWRRSDGGAALYGGLAAALLLSLPLLRRLRIPAAAFWDAATVTLLVGMIFTKAGCLMHGCCAGRPTESWFGFYLPNAQGVRRRRVPSQILEAGLAALLLVMTCTFWNRLPFDGALFLLALAVYAAARWALESARETTTSAGGLNLNRAISASLVAISVAGLFLFGGSH